MVQYRLIALALVILLISGAAFAAQSGGMRPGVTRPITGTLTTDTATLADLEGQISWQSTAASPKTQTLPGCDNTINGLTITVIDGAGTADTLPITVNATAGTVAGSAAGTQITSRNQGAIFACNGSATNWNVSGTLAGSGPIVFPQIVSEQVCPATVSGTGAGKTFTPTCAVSTITIDTNGQTILVPNNMPGTSGMAGYTLDITYSGSGTLAPNWGTGTNWTNKSAPAVCSGTVTSGCISATSGAFDRIVGQSLSNTNILYGAPITNYGAAVPAPTIVQGPVAGFGGSTGITTRTISMTGVTAGDTMRIGVAYCQNSNCTGTGTVSVSSVSITTGSGTCAMVTGSNNFTAVVSTSLWRCSGLSAGSITATINWSANAFFNAIGAVELRNDNGSEAGNVGIGTSASPAATTGTLSQANNEMALAFAYVVNGPDITAVASPFTFLHVGSAGTGIAFGYALTSGCSSCTLTSTFTASGSGTWAVSTSGVLHP